MANRNFTSQKLFQLDAYPVKLACKFTVDSAAPTGITDLVGPGFRSVIMGSGSPSEGHANPNPGFILIQLQDCYNKLLGYSAGFQAPPTGAEQPGTDERGVYQITTLGTATAADWQANGLPVGITPALGVTFVATATGDVGDGDAGVKLIGNSFISSVELVGDPSLMNVVSSQLPALQGMYIILQCLDAEPVPAAPTDGTKVTLELYLSNSTRVTSIAG